MEGCISTKPLRQNKELRTMMWDRITETKVHEGTYRSRTYDLALSKMEIQLWRGSKPLPHIDVRLGGKWWQILVRGR
jgi:hypothetical protein